MVQVLPPGDCEKGILWAADDKEIPSPPDHGKPYQWRWCPNRAPIPSLEHEIDAKLVRTEDHERVMWDDASLTQALEPFKGIRRVWEDGFYRVELLDEEEQAIVQSRTPCGDFSATEPPLAQLEPKLAHRFDPDKISAIQVGWLQVGDSWCGVYLDGPTSYRVAEDCQGLAPEEPGHSFRTSLILFDMAEQLHCSPPGDGTNLDKYVLSLELRGVMPEREGWSSLMVGLAVVGGILAVVLVGFLIWWGTEQWKKRSGLQEPLSSSGDSSTKKTEDLLRGRIHKLWQRLPDPGARERLLKLPDRINETIVGMSLRRLESEPARKAELNQALRGGQMSKILGEDWDRKPIQEWTPAHRLGALVVILNGLSQLSSSQPEWVEVDNELDLTVFFWYDRFFSKDREQHVFQEWTVGVIRWLLQSLNEVIYAPGAQQSTSYPRSTDVPTTSNQVRRPDWDPREDPADEKTVHIPRSSTPSPPKPDYVHELIGTFRRVKAHPRVEAMLKTSMRLAGLQLGDHGTVDVNLVQDISDLQLRSEQIRLAADIGPGTYSERWKELESNLETAEADFKALAKGAFALLLNETTSPDLAVESLLHKEGFTPINGVTPIGYAAWRKLCPKLPEEARKDEGATFAKELARRLYQSVLLPWYHLAHFLDRAVPVELPSRAITKQNPRDGVERLNKYANEYGYRFAAVPLYDESKDRAHYIPREDVEVTSILPADLYDGLAAPPSAARPGLIVRVARPILEAPADSFSSAELKCLGE